MPEELDSFNGTEDSPTLNTDASSPLKPITERQIKKAKRTRAALITVILVAVVALGGLGYLGYLVFGDEIRQLITGEETPGGSTVSTPPKPGANIPDGNNYIEGAPEKIQVETIPIPDLKELYGLSADGVLAKLGSGFELTKTEPWSDSANPDIAQIVTFSSIAPGGAAQQAETSGAPTSTNDSYPIASVRCSVNGSGTVVDVYFSCDVRLIGFPETSFDALLATGDSVVNTLQAAGVTPRDYAYAPPDHESSIRYDNAVSENRKIIKQEAIFSGRSTADSGLTVWTVTVTYDYGISGVATTDDFSTATRTIKISLA